MDNNEQFINLEKKFQQELEAQKRFYESENVVLKSKFEFEKEKLRIDYESKLLSLQTELNTKHYNDMEALKKYYQSELESQRNWYEEEIIRRKKETEDWHVANLEKQTSELKKGYEELLKAQEDKFRVQEEALSMYIVENKKYYEAQLKPYKNIIKLQEKIQKKLKIKPKKKIEKLVEEVVEAQVQTSGIPKVSIILPVYNVGKYLRQSLDSLINQTLKEIEIICVNDGSVDDSYEILEEYKAKDNRIKVIHKENKGTGAARNDGLRLATGECIGFVDPDDWVKPNMFERLYNLIKEKDLDIAMCMPDGYDEKNAVSAPFPYFVDANFENIIDDRVFNWRDLSPFSYPMCVWNKLYTKELFDKHNIEFAEGLDFEDHKVIFGTLLTAEKIFFIREKLYVYRFNREGSVLTDNNRRLIDHIEIFDIVENLMKETNTFNLLREDFLTYKIHNILYYYSMIKDEFKSEYYSNMVQSIKDTNLTQDEYNMLCAKYPELKNVSLV
ncbi:MAG: glycosyltransferase [Candidatus Gastranaerophilales bacterium]|nr:glycosyltransferase [Candidatus Gastranaerophilales bacterium]